MNFGLNLDKLAKIGICLLPNHGPIMSFQEAELYREMTSVASASSRAHLAGYGKAIRSTYVRRMKVIRGADIWLLKWPPLLISVGFTLAVHGLLRLCFAIEVPEAWRMWCVDRILAFVAE